MEYNRIRELDNRYFMHVYNRQPVAFTHGVGSKLFSTTGDEYTDFWSGFSVNCLGHNDPELVKAVADQAARVMHVSNAYYSEVQSRLAELLVDGSDFTRVFLSNSGTDANECAIKLARRYLQAERKTILAVKNSYHGHTLTTIAASGKDTRNSFSHLPSGFKQTPYNDIAALRQALTSDVGAFMIELVQSEAGVVKVDYEFITMAYALCRANGILLIIDEVQTGAGRTGRMFAYEHYGIKPDIVTIANGLGGGIPIAATLALGKVADAFANGDHGTMSGGNTLACAAAVAVLTRLKSPGFLADVAKRGEYLHNALLRLKRHSKVQDVRGIGLLQGIQLDPARISGAEVVGKMLSRRFLINCAGNNTIRIAPPYIITEAEIDALVDNLDEMFGK